MYKPDGQHGTIIRGFQALLQPLEVGFFMNGDYFVGYKAGSRICELVEEGILIKNGERKNPKSHLAPFAIYSLTEKGKKYRFKNK